MVCKDCKQCVFDNLFKEKLSVDEMQLLKPYQHGQYFKKGEPIINEGDNVENFMYLNTGLVKLFIPSKNNSKDQIISLSKPLDCIGMMSIFSNQKYKYSVTAIEDSLVCFIELGFLREMIKKNGTFAMCFLEKMSEISDNVINTRIDLAKRHMRGRIANIILFFANNIYNNTRFELPVSRKEIAELVELSTENVIRLLSEFRKDNLISIEGKYITILDIKPLEQLSKLG